VYFWGILGDFQAEIFWGFFLYLNLEFLGDFFKFELATLFRIQRGCGRARKVVSPFYPPPEAPKCWGSIVGCGRARKVVFYLFSTGLLKLPNVGDPSEAVAKYEQHHDEQAHLQKKTKTTIRTLLKLIN
jgi:hypothetical protein